MRLLVDTHVWLWWLSEPSRLNSEALARLEDPNSVVLISAASVWEIVIKHSLGKLELPTAPEEFVPIAMAADGMAGLAIEHAHVLQVGQLPPLHRDPFDRLLVAQCQVESVPIMTADPLLLAYDIEVLKAD